MYIFFIFEYIKPKYFYFSDVQKNVNDITNIDEENKKEKSDEQK